MQNRNEDLRNHLFSQLERLSDESLLDTPEKIELEIKRAKAITDIASQLNDNSRIQIEAVKVAGEYGYKFNEIPVLASK